LQICYFTIPHNRNNKDLKLKISKSFHLAAAMFFLLNCIIINSQTDTSYVDKTHTSIEDSSIHTDSTETVYSKKTFLIKFDYDENRIILPAYRLKKSEIDFSDYRYAGNIISYLPFGHLNDFGSLGTPSEPVVFGFGNGNISLISDDDDISNYWNGSADLNFIQTENISAISVIPIHKAFLFGFNNNPASVLITTQDSLRTRPISRIRYYQAPNEEGFVDAFFSARVLKKFAMSIRATNHAIDNFYTNSESGAWKLNLKGIYKISDSVFTNLVLDHRKLNTPLNGGVDAELLLNSTGSLNDIYDNANPVMYDNLNNELLHNSIKNTVYGRILPWGFTRISLSYREHEEVFSYGDDTSSVKRSSYYKVWRAALSQKLEMSDLYLSFDGGYEFTDNKSSSYKSNKNLQNYYASFYTSYSLAENTVLPAVFGKYSYYNEQNTSGIGADTVSYTHLTLPTTPYV
jgi:hypothetical protein